MTPYILAFIAMFALDLCYARYTIACAAQRRLAASAWAAGTAVFGALNVLAFMAQPLAILSTAVGAFAGTWVGIGRDVPLTPDSETE